MVSEAVVQQIQISSSSTPATTAKTMPRLIARAPASASLDLSVRHLPAANGTVVDGHLRIKAARKLGSWPGGDTTAIPVILCDEWTPAQVKAFRLMVNRSVEWADWDEELLSLGRNSTNRISGMETARPAAALKGPSTVLLRFRRLPNSRAEAETDDAPPPIASRDVILPSQYDSA